MVAGSRLSISSVSNAPFAPALCSADAMNQFVEYSLSPPRGEDCWMPDTNATPINMAFQLPTCGISMGIGYDAGRQLERHVYGRRIRVDLRHQHGHRI